LLVALNEEIAYKFKYLSGHNEPIDQTTLVHRGCGINITPIELGSAKSIIELIKEIEDSCKIKIGKNDFIVSHGSS
jgi:hypothetical protein